MNNQKNLVSIVIVILMFLDIVSDFPMPENDETVDLTQNLPNNEIFWLHIEEGYFACQVNASEKYLKLFKISRLCDGIQDCYKASDEWVDHGNCTKTL